MKKIFFLLGAVAFLLSGFLFPSCTDVDGDNYYATTTIGTLEVSAKAYPGVNVLSWKTVKDAASYSVYRTIVNGKNEELVYSTKTADDVYYCDTDVDEETSYKYRVIANPKDVTVHDASQREVSLTTVKTATGDNLKGTWAPSGTVFSELAKYENDYNASDSVLSESTISVKLLVDNAPTVRVTFPVKAYASYKVYLSQANGGLLNEKSVLEYETTIYGYMYNKTATVDLTALYSGKKQVTVVAIPLNNTLYGNSVVASSATIEVKDFSDISSAVVGSVSASWTNYNSSSKVAKVRVYFSPSEYNEKEFEASEYTVYRAAYTSIGEEDDTYTAINGSALLVYDKIEKVGTPKKDASVSENEKTVYYIDDTYIDLSADKDISGIRYYVVLNHNGLFKTETSRILVPNDSESSWKFVPDTKSDYDVTNEAIIQNVYIDAKGLIHVEVDNTGNLSFTYGSFDTLREAETAVESELPTAITLSRNKNYDYEGTSNASVKDDKYYAFRLLSKKYRADDVVATMIAKVVKTGGAYYFNVEKNFPSKYASVGYPSVTLTSDVNSEDNTFNSITLTYSATDVNLYNIYRYIGDSWSDYSAKLIATVSDTTYTDEGVKGTKISKYNKVYYKVVAVGYYDEQESSPRNASGLAAPTISRSGADLLLGNVSDATAYYVYRATSKEALNELSATDYISSYSKSYSSYTIPVDCASDYYYAAKSWNSGDGYSSYSNVIEVKKFEAPKINNYVAYNAETSDPCWMIQFSSVEGYIGDYYLLTTLYNKGIEAADAKLTFESSPEIYIDSRGTITVTSYESAIYRNSAKVSVPYYYAVAIKDSNGVYSVSNVVEIFDLKNNILSNLTVTESGGTYSLSWEEIPNATKYNIWYTTTDKTFVSTGHSSILYGDNFSFDVIDTVTSTTYSYTPSRINTYVYFLVNGIGADDEGKGMTNFWSSYGN